MVINTIKNILPKGKGFPKPFQEIIDLLSSKTIITDDNIDKLWEAYQLGQKAHEGQLRRSGEPYFNHCIEVGKILSIWHLDINAVIAGLLHDSIEDTDINKTIITKNFGKEVTYLVEGVTKLSGIKFNSRQQKQAENFMKMFLSVASDIRVIIINPYIIIMQPSLN